MTGKIRKLKDFAKIEDEEKLEALFSPKKSFDLSIEGAFLDLEFPFNILILSKDESTSIVSPSLVKIFLQKKYPALVYVSVNKPVERLKIVFEREKISLSKVKFIDMITMQTGAKKLQDKSVSYLSSTSSLNDLMDEIEKCMSGAPAKKALIFDSVSTLLVYNDPLPVEKLVHSLIGKLSNFKSAGIFLMAKSQEQE
ncbi:MAG: hypothetical protein HYW50_01960, partial [Candidatus Diapherotrites archaeon]|nr:hypothetical protein [Candidatus Diapherotrites archaeon]